MIKYYEIEEVLKSTSSLVAIRIQHWGDLQTVYLTAVLNTGFWARNHFNHQDTKIFPNRNVKILKIGSQPVQSYLEFQQEKRDYYDMVNTIAKEKKRKSYSEAYRHAKVLGAGEPII